MNLFLIFIAVVIITCVMLNNATNRVGVPVLLAFILLGMLFGNNGLLPVKVESYKAVEQICSAALIFIMFYGGFGTRWDAARPVAAESVLLATAGVVLTAGFTGAFCHFLLRWQWPEALLMGSVVASTDAASVFSILRSRKLGLKNGTAPLLELESGSNDPCSYMLTAVMLSVMQGTASGGQIMWQLFAQLFFGAVLGLLIAQAAAFGLRHITFATSGFDSMFLIAVALFAYAIPAAVGGNGYLSAYIVGIILGNRSFSGKKEMVHFFDGFTGLMQVLIFFMLGLLAHPAELHRCILPALAIFFIMLLVSRPLATLLLLTPFGKYGFRQQTLISFCGLRGAASIVFAIMAVGSGVAMTHDIFNIVFCIVLLSISLQGTLLPFVAKRLGMIDKEADVMKTFSDFSDEVPLQFTHVPIHADGSWTNKRVRDLGIPRGMLLCLVVKPDGSQQVPVGDTLLEDGDSVILCTKAYDGKLAIPVREHTVSAHSRWDGIPVRDYPSGHDRLILIRRDGKDIIPHGDTLIHAGDHLYINRVQDVRDTAMAYHNKNNNHTLSK